MRQQGKHIAKLPIANFVARAEGSPVQLFECSQNIGTAHSAGKREQRAPNKWTARNSTAIVCGRHRPYSPAAAPSGARRHKLTVEIMTSGGEALIPKL
jgi:hypothetical protein